MDFNLATHFMEHIKGSYSALRQVECFIISLIVQVPDSCWSSSSLSAGYDKSFSSPLTPSLTDTDCILASRLDSSNQIPHRGKSNSLKKA